MRNAMNLFVVVLLLGTSAVAGQAAKLPSDFFLPEFGTLEQTIEINQISDKEFQIRQHLGGQPIPKDYGTLMNFMAFCVGYGLSSAIGYSGWSLTMKQPIGDTPTERYLTVRLANGSDELKDIALPKDWTGYVENVKIRDATCKHFVNPQYLK